MQERWRDGRFVLDTGGRVPCDLTGRPLDLDEHRVNVYAVCEEHGTRRAKLTLSLTAVDEFTRRLRDAHDADERTEFGQGILYAPRGRVETGVSESSTTPIRCAAACGDTVTAGEDPCLLYGGLFEGDVAFPLCHAECVPGLCEELGRVWDHAPALLARQV